MADGSDLHTERQHHPRPSPTQPSSTCHLPEYLATAPSPKCRQVFPLIPVSPLWSHPLEEAGLPKGQLSDGINLQPTPPPPSLTAQHRHSTGPLALQPNLPECAATNFTEAKAEAQTCVKEEHSNKYTCTDSIKFTINFTSTSAITIHTQHARDSPAAPADDQKSTLSSNELAKMHLASTLASSLASASSCIGHIQQGSDSDLS